MKDAVKSAINAVTKRDSRLLNKDRNTIDSSELAENLFNAMRNDYWHNAAAGLGVATTDPTVSTNFAVRPRLSASVLDRLYLQNSIAARIIDRPAYDAIRKGWQVTLQDSEDEIVGLDKAYKALKVKQNLQKAIAYARLYGSSITVIHADDGQKPIEPLGERIVSIARLKVYDRYQVRVKKIYRNPANPNFGEPEIYSITSVESGNTMDVHESRVIRFDGVKAPARCLVQNDGFGFSEMDRIFPEIRAYCSAHQWVENIVKDFNQDVFQVGNLQQLLSANETETIRERFRIIKLAKSILNAVVIGGGESYEKKTTNVSGLDKLLEQFQYLLGAATGIPLTFLFGRSPAGENATGESDIINYYDGISSYQEADLEGPVNYLTQLILRSKDGPTNGNDPENWTIVFNPLWQLDGKEQAELDKLIAERDEVYVANKILLPDEVAQARFADSKGDVSMDEKLRQEKEKAQAELLELMSAAGNSEG